MLLYLPLLYFVWAKSKVKVCFYFHILWCRTVFAQLLENIAHLGKHSTLGKNKFILSIIIDSELPFTSITVEELQAHCFSSEMAKGLNTFGCFLYCLLPFPS